MELVYINDVDLYDEYGLLLAHKEIGIPQKQLLQIEIPGRDGLLDLTDNFYGTSKYGNRTITLSFVGVKGFKNNDTDSEYLSILLAAFHGKMCELVFEGDSSYYYYGRCSIDEWSDVKRRSLTMTFDCDPYKRLITDPTTKVL